ncbi:MAG: Response regulator [Hyphomicrobiales bacterium]|nr:Response regulator [Hyphomicrobiales bacterium]
MFDFEPHAGPHIQLGELLGALSHALDMTEGQPAGHCVRCCWIGTRIGQAIGMSDAELGDLTYTLLLKDLGCSSNAARICQLYLTDDLDFKRDFKEIDGSLPKVLRFVLAHTGLKAGLAERFRAMLNIIQNGGEIARELIETRCQRGAGIARQLRFSEAVAEGITGLDEHWDGSGQPLGKVGTDIPMFARIALMAQVIDVFFTAGGAETARLEVSRRSGGWFDPALVDAFQSLADDPGFWAERRADDLQARVLALDAAQKRAPLNDDFFDDIATAFAQVVDSKSPFTAGHSERVALFTDMIAEAMDIAPGRRRWLKRTALLHDIGKLGVSNSILDKPAKLDDAEFEAMKLHAAYSEVILSRVAAFADMARIAGAHHERLDGKGYPRGIAGDEICLETRIITTADIFDALTADRPYRAAMPVSKALGIMTESLGTALDPVCFEALQRALAKIQPAQAA